MTRLRTILFLILISLIVTLGTQLAEQFSNQDDDKIATFGRSDVDYSIDDFKLTTMDRSGQTRYHLSAESMEHYQSSDETRLKQLNISLFKAPDTYWKIQSSTGIVAPLGKSVALSGNVIIKRDSKTESNPITITTDKLHIDIKNNIISTQSTIKLVGNGVNIQSKGLLTNMNKQTIQLQSNVRGSYAPVH